MGPENKPSSPDTLNQQAILKLQTEDKEGAKSILLDLIKQWPAESTAYNTLACIFRERGDFENAVKYFEDALRISKYNKTVVLAYGNMLLSLKRFERAKMLFEEYLTNQPEDLEIRSLLQKSEGILEKSENSIRWWKRLHKGSRIQGVKGNLTTYSDTQVYLSYPLLIGLRRDVKYF